MHECARGPRLWNLIWATIFWRLRSLSGPSSCKSLRMKWLPPSPGGLNMLEPNLKESFKQTSIGSNLAFNWISVPVTACLQLSVVKKQVLSWCVHSCINVQVKCLAVPHHGLGTPQRSVWLTEMLWRFEAFTVAIVIQVRISNQQNEKLHCIGWSEAGGGRLARVKCVY